MNGQRVRLGRFVFGGLTLCALLGLCLADTAYGLRRVGCLIISVPLMLTVALRKRPSSRVEQGDDLKAIIQDIRSKLAEVGTTLGVSQSTREDIHLSIVIPAYNEQTRLPRTILETIRWCSARDLEFEIIIADDGSRDGTLTLARVFEESHVGVRVLACPHIGKGAAVRLGMLNAKGRIIMFMDADGATPLDEILKLVAVMDEGHDVVIGSRVSQYRGEVRVDKPFHRLVMGRMFAFFVNLFAVGKIADTQCGFKMFRREAAAVIFSQQRLSGFAFDVEVLFIANRLSLSTIEIPVNWAAQAGSKVNLVTDSLRMLRDIALIRWLHRDLKKQLSQSRAASAYPVNRAG